MAEMLLCRAFWGREVLPLARGARIVRPCQRRYIGEKYLAKMANAELAWKERAAEIDAGKKESFLSMLEERGFVKDITGSRDTLDRLLTAKRIRAYVGVDPTAPSMHVGNMLPLMVLFWMYLHGFGAHTVLGGATARIGDPSGRNTTREREHSGDRKANMASMHMQIKKLWTHVEASGKRHGYEWEWAWKRALNNNNAWLNKLSIVEFMTLMGSGFRLGPMLSRDSVKLRMESGEGMSFTEFSYPLIQAWDWWYLYQSVGVQLQIGGSDQYGNILTGVEAVNFLRKTHPDPNVTKPLGGEMMDVFGLTVPLLTTAAGEKFGKSAGNAIWLDKDMLSSFDLYQFFVRTADDDVERYLKLLTFLPLSTIAEVMERHNAAPHDREAQHLLAMEFVSLVHGREDAKKAEAQHRIIFASKSGISTSDLKKLAAEEEADPQPKSEEFMNPSVNKFAPQVNSKNAPKLRIVLPRSLVVGRSFASVLVSAGLASSRSEGHRLGKNQAAHVASRPGQVGKMGDELKWTPIKNFNASETEKYLIDGKLMMLRVGKWNMRICELVDDEEFAARGLTCPGWDDELQKPLELPQPPSNTPTKVNRWHT